eukprot:526612_1
MSPVNTCDPCIHLFIWCTIVLNTILFISTISILISFVRKRSKASPKLPKQLFYSSFAFIIGSSLALLVSMFAITLSIDVCNILFNITCYSFNPPFIRLIGIMHILFSMSIDIFFVQRTRRQCVLVMLSLFLSYLIWIIPHGIRMLDWFWMHGIISWFIGELLTHVLFDSHHSGSGVIYSSHSVTNKFLFWVIIGVRLMFIEWDLWYVGITSFTLLFGVRCMSCWMIEWLCFIGIISTPCICLSSYYSQ